MKKLVSLQKQSHEPIPTSSLNPEATASPISVKLDGTNYSIWSQAVSKSQGGTDLTRSQGGVVLADAPTEGQVSVGASDQEGNGAAGAHLCTTHSMPTDAGTNEQKNVLVSKQTHQGMSLLTKCDFDNWIIDLGATGHMTFRNNDLKMLKEPRVMKNYNANGVEYPVLGAGDVQISQSLILNNTLFVPSLQNRLISVGQITEELNCAILMFPDFCIFQDILTKEIIGCGTKRGRLYHLEDLKAGSTNLASGISKSEDKI